MKFYSHSFSDTWNDGAARINDRFNTIKEAVAAAIAAYGDQVAVVHVYSTDTKLQRLGQDGVARFEGARLDRYRV